MLARSSGERNASARCEVVQRGTCAKIGAIEVFHALAEERLRERRIARPASSRDSRTGVRAAAGAAASRLARPEAAHLGFLEQVVAAEHLVGAFAGQHHLVACFAHAPESSISGTGAVRSTGASVWRIRRGNASPMSRRRAAQRRVVGAEVAHHRLLVLALVELGVLEGDRERAHRRVGEAADHRDDAGRIESAAEVGADRHVGAQLQAHRVDQQLAQLFGRPASTEDRTRARLCRIAGSVQSQ